MGEYYVSLCGELLGIYIWFRAPTENHVRAYAHQKYGSLWCSVYTRAETTKAIQSHGGMVWNQVPIELFDLPPEVN